MLTRDRVAFLLREQARTCERFGSPLYADLLAHAATNAEGGGVVFDLLAPHDAPSARAGALALRLMAAVHRLVLTGEAPGLAAHYPSVGGFRTEAYPAFEQVLLEQTERLRPLLALPCQTNEVGRAAALAFGFFEIAAATRLPLRLLEIGASAGLNLLWDRYRYGGDHASWGEVESPVDLTGLWLEAPVVVPQTIRIMARRGCDLQPIDGTSADGRLSLEASLWADQVARFARLRGALAIAARSPVTVDSESVDEWLPRQLAERTPGVATVVYHSIVQEYFSETVRRAFLDCLSEAFSLATTDSPLFWLRLEPVSEGGVRYAVSLRGFPGDLDRVIAWSGPHGSDVSRPS